MSKFTKGPWTYYAQKMEIQDENGVELALLPEWLIEHHNERDANGCLMSSAPDLYEALKEIADGIHVEHANDARLVEKARAALRKAQGL